MSLASTRLAHASRWDSGEQHALARERRRVDQMLAKACIEAPKRGLKPVIEALGLGARPDCADMSEVGHLSALVFACRSDLPELARLLVSSGANPDGQRGMMSPLSQAIVKDCVEIAKVLIKAGAGIAHPPHGESGPSPLSRCATHDSIGCLNVLLGMGVGVDSGCNEAGSKTALMAAASSASLRCFSRLLEVGADPWVPDHEGRDAMIHACAEGSLDCVLTLMGLPGSERHVDRWLWAQPEAWAIGQWRRSARSGLSWSDHRGNEPDLCGDALRSWARELIEESSGKASASKGPLRV